MTHGKIELVECFEFFTKFISSKNDPAQAIRLILIVAADAVKIKSTVCHSLDIRGLIFKWSVDFEATNISPCNFDCMIWAINFKIIFYCLFTSVCEARFYGDKFSEIPPHCCFFSLSLRSCMETNSIKKLKCMLV